MTWTRQSSFYALMVGLGILTVVVLWEYLPLLFMALALVMVFEPLYGWYTRKVRREGIAAILTTVTILVGVIVPLMILIMLAVQQAAVLVGQLAVALSHSQATVGWMESFTADYWPGLVDGLATLLTQQQSQLYSMVQSTASGLGQLLTRGVVPAVASTARGILDTFVFIFLLTYLFEAKKPLFARLRRLSFLSTRHHDRFMKRFEGVVRATMKGSLLVGLVQGVLGAIVMALLSVQGAALWGLLMGVTSVLPLGAGLVWWPVGVALILSGRWVTGLVWIGFCLVVISTIDNVIRSKVMGAGEEAVPELVTFLAILGGVRVFGFLGVVMGPLVAALFLTALDMYEEERMVGKTS